jgi:hypothetical protein
MLLSRNLLRQPDHLLKLHILNKCYQLIQLALNRQQALQSASENTVVMVIQLGQEAFHNLKLQLDCDYWRNQLDDARSTVVVNKPKTIVLYK